MLNMGWEVCATLCKKKKQREGNRKRSYGQSFLISYLIRIYISEQYVFLCKLLTNISWSPVSQYFHILALYYYTVGEHMYLMRPDL